MLPAAKLKIVILGGSGQVGTIPARHFTAQGHHVTVLSRNVKPAPWPVLLWDGVHPGPWTEALEGADVLINLAGRSVNCRYNAQNRKEIYDSRIDATRLLNEVIPTLKSPPSLWMNASTATIYRHALDRPMDEATGELGGNEPGAPETWNFSIKVAKDWEETFFSSRMASTGREPRKIALRSAVTFSPDSGGVFDVLSGLVRHGLGGRNGSGDQMVSWIHAEDFSRAIDFLIADQSISGAVNLSAPNPLPNAVFMKALRLAWKMPSGLPAPAWMIEFGCFLMRTESELVLKSRWVLPDRLEKAGFQFLHPNWIEAAQDLVQAWKSAHS